MGRMVFDICKNLVYNGTNKSFACAFESENGVSLADRAAESGKAKERCCRKAFLRSWRDESGGNGVNGLDRKQSQYKGK